MKSFSEQEKDLAILFKWGFITYLAILLLINRSVINNIISCIINY